MFETFYYYLSWIFYILLYALLFLHVIDFLRTGNLYLCVRCGSDSERERVRQEKKFDRMQARILENDEQLQVVVPDFTGTISDYFNRPLVSQQRLQLQSTREQHLDLLREQVEHTREMKESMAQLLLLMKNQTNVKKSPTKTILSTLDTSEKITTPGITSLPQPEEQIPKKRKLSKETTFNQNVTSIGRRGSYSNDSSSIQKAMERKEKLNSV